MMRRAWSILFTATAAAGVVAAIRQRREAMAVRAGRLRRAGASADLPPARPAGWCAERLATWVPERPRTRLGRLLGSVWAAPLSLAGTLLALLGGQVPRYEPALGCYVARGVSGPSGLALRLVGADANTVGQVVLSRRAHPDPVLLAHEAVHARQTERLGAALLPVYVWFGARYGYRDHPLERAARRGAQLARQRGEVVRRS